MLAMGCWLRLKTIERINLSYFVFTMLSITLKTRQFCVTVGMATGDFPAPKIKRINTCQYCDKNHRLTLHYDVHRYLTNVVKARRHQHSEWASRFSYSIVNYELEWNCWNLIEKFQWIRFFACERANCWFVSHSAYATCPCPGFIYEWLVFASRCLSSEYFQMEQFFGCSSNPFFLMRKTKKHLRKNMPSINESIIEYSWDFGASITTRLCRIDIHHFRIVIFSRSVVPFDNLID